MTARIGLLWDSLTPNIGDQAIGLTLLRLARQAGFDRIEPATLEPGYSTEFDVLVIGGGELLQPAGDPFYDAFRVPGRHILNTVGTSGEVDAAYLDDYRLVSVRSEADRRNLREVSREVVVTPCLTVLFDGVAATVEAPSLPQDSIGVHVSPASVDFDRLSEIPALLKGLGTAVRFFTFTHYNQDRHVARAVLGRADGDTSEVLHLADSDVALATIRQMRAVICTSLHATIFAYLTGTPFVSIAYSAKVRAFLEERGLAERAAPSLADVAERLDLLAPERVDWSRQLANDRDRARSYVGSLLDELERASSESTGTSKLLPRFRQEWKGARPGAAAPYGRWTEPTHAREAHGLEMSVYREYGLRVADAIAARKYTSQLEAACADADSRRKDIEDLHRRLEGYARDLESLASARQRTLEEVEAYVRKLETLTQGDS